MAIFRQPKCSRCSRLRAACICHNVTRGHIQAGKRSGVDARPHPCPKCRRTVRGGICPGPDC